MGVFCSTVGWEIWCLLAGMSAPIDVRQVWAVWLVVWTVLVQAECNKLTPIHYFGLSFIPLSLRIKASRIIQPKEFSRPGRDIFLGRD